MMLNEIINITVIDRSGQKQVLEAPTDMGLNLMEFCKMHELPVEGVCGGMAMCASCHCYVHTHHVVIERNDDEQAMLDDTDNVKSNSRLGCQVPISEDMHGLVIELAPLLHQDESVIDW